MVRLEMLALALVMGLMSSFTAITMSTVPLPGVPHWIMVVFWFPPTMVTLWFTYKAPKLPEKSLVTFPMVSEYVVPVCSMIVSPLALSMASRKLHEDDISAKLVLLHALLIGDVGVGSVVLLTKNVGSGIGIVTEGATCPWCKAMIPGRPSTLMRAGNAAAGEPLYGLIATWPLTD